MQFWNTTSWSQKWKKQIEQQQKKALLIEAENTAVIAADKKKEKSKQSKKILMEGMEPNVTEATIKKPYHTHFASHSVCPRT